MLVVFEFVRRLERAGVDSGGLIAGSYREFVGTGIGKSQSRVENSGARDQGQ